MKDKDKKRIDLLMNQAGESLFGNNIGATGEIKHAVEFLRGNPLVPRDKTHKQISKREPSIVNVPKDRSCFCYRFFDFYEAKQKFFREKIGTDLHNFSSRYYVDTRKLSEGDFSIIQKDIERGDYSENEKNILSKKLEAIFKTLGEKNYIVTRNGYITLLEEDAFIVQTGQYKKLPKIYYPNLFNIPFF